MTQSTQTPPAFGQQEQSTPPAPPDPTPGGHQGPATEIPVRPAGFGLVLFSVAFLFTLVGFTINFLGNATDFFPSPLHPSTSDRSWKTRRLDEAVAAGRAPQVLIMGSSRVMQVQPDYVAALTGKRVFNYGLSAASPLDFLTELRYVLRIGAKPELVIVGIDEVSCSNLLSRYFYQAASHWGLFRSLPMPERIETTSGVLRSIDLHMTWSSFKTVMGGVGPRNRKINRVSAILLDDGYLIYRDKELAREEGTYDLSKQILETVERWNVGMAARGPDAEQALRLRERKLQLFDQFLNLANENGVKVYVMLLPLHPDYAEAISTPAMRELRGAIRQRLERSCNDRGVLFRDFTSLASYDGDPQLFWDGAHQQPENLRRMINTLFGHPPRWVAAPVPSDQELLNHLPPVTTLNTW
jgi:hypothetical protein